MPDILITGGQVVTPAGVAVLDVAITGQNISTVAEPGSVSPETPASSTPPEK